MKEGLLSVIIISYENSSLVLKRTIQSVREQEYPDYEIILVDANEEGGDYSKGLQEDMEDYPDIQFVSRPSRPGRFASAKNRGAKVAQGEYIAYLWAGDAWNPEYAKKQIEALQRESEAGLAFCRFWTAEEDAFSTEYRRPPLEAVEDVLGEENYSVSQMMFRRKVFYEMHGFDVHIRGMEDFDLWLRISEKYPVSETKQKLVCKYREPGQQQERPDVTGYLQLYSKHKQMYDSNPADKLDLFQRITACFRSSRNYWRWLQCMKEVKRLEKKVVKNKKHETTPTQ